MHKLLLFSVLSFWTVETLNAQAQLNQELEALFLVHVKNGLVDYSGLQGRTAERNSIKVLFNNTDVSALSQSEQIAFYLNAYNFFAVNTVTENYPSTSPQKIPGFYKVKKHDVGGQSLSLDELEFKKVFQIKPDPRYHFALVCAAKGCPPLTRLPFIGARLEQQLDERASFAVNDPQFIRHITANEIEISEIFKWYSKDFETAGGTKAFIEKYSMKPINASTVKTRFYPYDWQLNDAANTATEPGPATVAPNDRFLTSALYNRGEYEIHLFNNYYSQKDVLNNASDLNSRYIFFSMLGQFLYGINPRLNVGLDARFRSVHQSTNGVTPFFSALGFSNEGNTFDESGQFSGYNRTGLSSLGPRVKYLPFKNIQNLSVQHTLYLPIGSDLEGNSETGYLDWSGSTFWTQVFFDTDITSKVSIFVEVDFIAENIAASTFKKEGGYYQVGTPMTVITSYFPTPKWTLYGLIGSAPRWGHFRQDASSDRSTSYVPFSQLGGGIKYFLSDNFQIELLGTAFYDATAGRKASTLNVGLRYFKR